MREIVYIQSGNLANYVGAHFWNTQECYLTDEGENVYDRRVSFRESLADSGPGEGAICYSPRALIFDHKSNFGTFAQSNILSSTGNEEPSSTAGAASLWQGAVDEQQSDPIPKSDYHAKLERDDENPDAASPRVQSGASVRYWADFSRLYFGAHSFQAVPDSYTSGRSADGDWGASRDTFSRFNEETDVTDTAVRILLEECDNSQGFQMTTDVCQFGGFAHGLVETLRDEYPKLPVLDFALLSSAVPADVDVDDTAGTRRAITDALYLRDMGEVASGIVPIQAPGAWKKWESPGVSADLSLAYHSSAIVSAHVESITLPMRQRNLNVDLSSLIASLAWRGQTSFVQLGGIIPATDAEDWAKAAYNFSLGRPAERIKADTYARVDVVRGFNDASFARYEDWSSRYTSSQSAVNSYQAAGYPLPSSFPTIFDVGHLENPAVEDIHSVSATSCLSSLTTSSAMAGLFSGYATFLERLRRRPAAMGSIDFLEGDDWRELTNDFWTMHDNYDNGASDGDNDELGEDEGF